MGRGNLGILLSLQDFVAKFKGLMDISTLSNIVRMVGEIPEVISLRCQDRLGACELCLAN